MAPRGAIEFVPKTEPMVVELLELREGNFPHYNEEYVMKCSHERAHRGQRDCLASGRKLFAFERAVL